MAKDLRKEYKEEFAAMLVDAKANTTEAQENLQAAMKDLNEKENHLSELKATAVVSGGHFLNDGKEMIKFALSKNVLLDTLRQIAENILTYVSAKEAIPEAEQEIADAAAVKRDAEGTLYTAMSEESAIQAFATVTTENESEA